MEESKKLIEKIKNGDEEAFRKLLFNYRKMIYKIINSFSTDNGDFTEDVESMYQEGCIALYNAVFSYEEKRGAKFSSYAFLCIRSKIMSYYRKACKYRSHEYYSIDTSENIDSRLSVHSRKFNEDPIYYHKEMEFKEFLDKFIDTLSNRDRKVLEMRNENYTYKEIAKELNINPKKVDNILRTIKKKLKKYLNEDNENQE